VRETPPTPTNPSATQGDLFELVVESAIDFAIFTFAADGIVTSWNAGAERLLGYSELEIVGSSADVIFTAEDKAAGAPEKERQIAGSEGRAVNERWHTRKDGTRFWGSGLVMPLRDEAMGFAKIMRDLTERHEADERIRASEARFRLLATSIPQLVFLTKPDGQRLWGSPQWIQFSGLSLDESLKFGWLDAVHPDDREATLSAWETARRTGEHYSEQRVRREADGTYRWHQMRARPIAESHGEWVGTMTDIHDLKSLSGRQAVLVAELQHRTRNLLAVVQSIASKTIRSSQSLEDFADDFEGRLRALSRVQGLLARVEQTDLNVREIVDAELAAYADADAGGRRVKTGGPVVELPATSAQAIALALHELATNAVKHGALAHPSGRLAVTWDLDNAGSEPHVTLDWRESGVPMRNGDTPARMGYGTELIERALPYQLKAKTKLEYRTDGVHCSIAVPVSAGGEGKG
jgi:PAS domain S-box-containing protein